MKLNKGVTKNIACKLLTNNQMIFLVQFIIKTTGCTLPTAS